MEGVADGAALGDFDGLLDGGDVDGLAEGPAVGELEGDDVASAPQLGTVQ